MVNAEQRLHCLSQVCGPVEGDHHHRGNVEWLICLFGHASPILVAGRINGPSNRLTDDCTHRDEAHLTRSRVNDTARYIEGGSCAEAHVRLALHA